MNRKLFHCAAVVLVAALAGCAGDGNPAAPSPPAAPPAPQPPPQPSTWSITGTVSMNDAGTPIAGARIDLIEGPDQGKRTNASDDGRFAFRALREGTHELRATAEGFEEERRTVTLTADQTVDFALRHTPSAPAPSPNPAPPAPPPSPPDPPAPPAHVFSGSLVDGISEAPVAGASVDVTGLGVFTTAANGIFEIGAPDPETVRTVTINSAAIVPRTTFARIPGPDTEFTTIPASFDLAAFDEMFRGSGQLQRWVAAPHLTIQRRVLQFTNVTAEQYVAVDSLMSEDDANLLVADLSWGIPQLSDNKLGFASERRETAAVGASVNVARTGEIVVARFAGLQAATGFWGYGRWASDGAGSIRAGIIMLDAAFDTSGSVYRRSLRVHELGHALGYNHVTSRESVMNSSAQTEPNQFDLQGARLAFLRPPGNRSPDRDPDAFTVNLGTGVLIWKGDR